MTQMKAIQVTGPQQATLTVFSLTSDTDHEQHPTTIKEKNLTGPWAWRTITSGRRHSLGKNKPGGPFSVQMIGSFVHSHVHSFPSTFCSLLFKQAHLWHMEVPGPGVKSELQLPAYDTATATPDLNHIWELYHSSWQHQIFNPPEGGARDQKHILTETTSGPEPS